MKVNDVKGFLKSTLPIDELKYLKGINLLFQVRIANDINGSY